MEEVEEGPNENSNPPPPENEIRRKIRECFQLTDFNTCLATAFILINFIWWIRNNAVEGGDLSIFFVRLFEPNSTFFRYFQSTFHGLGFLPVRKEDITSPAVYAALTFMQLYLACSLLWGIVIKNARRLDQWIFLTGALWTLNALYTLYICFHPNPRDFLFPTSNVAISFWLTFVGYYTFNTLYVLRIYSLRGRLMSSIAEQIPQIETNVFMCSNQRFLHLAAVIHLFTSLYWIMVVIIVDRTWDTFLDLIIKHGLFRIAVDTLYFCVGCAGFGMSIYAIRANTKSNALGLQYWLWFQIFICLLFFESMAASIVKASDPNEYTEELLTSILRAFFVYEFPVLFTIWVTYVRLQEIQYAPRRAIVSSYYIPSVQAIYLSMGTVWN